MLYFPTQLNAVLLARVFWSTIIHLKYVYLLHRKLHTLLVTPLNEEYGQNSHQKKAFLLQSVLIHCGVETITLVTEWGEIQTTTTGPSPTSLTNTVSSELDTTSPLLSTMLGMVQSTRASTECVGNRTLS